MGFKAVLALDAEKCITIGGSDKKTGKKNPLGIEGHYLGSRKTEGGKYGPSTIHFFSTPNGNVGVWGKTNLTNQLGNVNPGVMTRVTYKGLKSTKNGDMHAYLVEVDKDDTIDVDLPVATNSSSGSDYEEDSDDIQDEYAPEADEESEEDDEVEEAPRAVARPSAEERKAKVDALLKKKKAV